MTNEEWNDKAVLLNDEIRDIARFAGSSRCCLSADNVRNKEHYGIVLEGIHYGEPDKVESSLPIFKRQIEWMIKAEKHMQKCPRNHVIEFYRALSYYNDGSIRYGGNCCGYPMLIENICSTIYKPKLYLPFDMYGNKYDNDWRLNFSRLIKHAKIRAIKNQKRFSVYKNEKSESTDMVESHSAPF